MHISNRNGKLPTLLSLFYGRIVLFLLRTAIPPFIPFLMEKFGWNSFQVGLLASAYLWSYAFAQVPWGIAVDKWGGKKSLALGWAITVIASLAFAFGSDLEQLMFTRLLFGVGAASVLVASTVIIAEVYPKDEMGSAMGVISASSSIGTLVAGIAIPWLLVVSIQLPALETWRTICVVITIPAVLALIALAPIPDMSHKTRRESTENPGSSEAKWSKRQVMRDPRLYMMSAAMLGYIGGYTISSTWIYVYLQEQYGLPIELVGVIASLAIFVPAIPGALISGWLSDRFRSRVKVAAAGALLAGAALSVLIFKLPLHFVILALIIYGAFALFHTPIFSMPAETWSVEVSGTAVSIITGISQFGAAITPALSGFLLLHSNNYGPVWIFGGVVYFGATIALLLTREKHCSD
jgi:MFS family permease